MEQKINKVSVIGAGTMGVQIAVHASCFGYVTSIFDIDGSRLKESIKKVRLVGSGFRASIISEEEWMAVANKLTNCASLEEAVHEADLVIEAGPERIDIKRDIFRQLDEFAPGNSILASGSSAIPVSQLTTQSRIQSSINLHFYPPTNIVNMVDVMGNEKTSVETLKIAREWVQSIGCVPLSVKKEIMGFCYNRIWRAIKKEVLFLWANDYVDFQEIDRAWMIANNTPMGPFGLMDAAGLDVIYDIENIYYKSSNDPDDLPPEALKRKIECGELGAKSLKGFYRYPNPEYMDSEFLDPNNPT